MKMKKIIFSVFMVFILLGTTSSAEVGIVVEFPDGSIITKCLSITENESGYDTMQSSSLPLVWSPPSVWGHALCKISDTGCPSSNCWCSPTDYWNFYLQQSGSTSWRSMPVGWDAGTTCWNRDWGSFVGHYCAVDGDVIGLKYGPFGSKPSKYTFEELCGEDSQQRSKRHSIKILKIRPESVVSETGKTLEFRVRVKNKGKYNEFISLKGGNLPRGWNSSTDSFELDRSKRAEKTLKITIPRGTRPGYYTLRAEVSGWGERERKSFTVEVLPECRTDDDCRGDEFCFKEICRRLSCEAAENHRCVPRNSITGFVSGSSGETETGKIEAEETEARETETGEIGVGETEAGETKARETEAGETKARETEAGKMETGKIEYSFDKEIVRGEPLHIRFYSKDPEVAFSGISVSVTSSSATETYMTDKTGTISFKPIVGSETTIKIKGFTYTDSYGHTVSFGDLTLKVFAKIR